MSSDGTTGTRRQHVKYRHKISHGNWHQRYRMGTTWCNLYPRRCCRCWMQSQWLDRSVAAAVLERHAEDHRQQVDMPMEHQVNAAETFAHHRNDTPCCLRQRQYHSHQPLQENKQHTAKAVLYMAMFLKITPGI